MIAYDLFAGAGGATCGLIEAGYDVHAFEKWDVAADTHDANHDRPTHRIDLMQRVPAGPTPHLLWASPPCQPFSAAGAQLGEFDDRDCIPGFIAAVEHHRPPIVLMENVKGLSFEKHWLYVDTVIFEQLRMLGYRAEWRVLDAADYGVPQNRERFILIARRDGGPIAWPMPTHTAGDSLFLQPWVSMAEALPELLGCDDADRPAMALTEKARSMTVRTGANSMVTGRTGTRAGDGDVQPYERSLDRPAPTVDTKAGSAWTVNTGRDWKPGGTRADAQTFDPTDRPAPAIDTKGRWWVDRPATTIQGDPRCWPPGHKINADDRARLGADAAAERYGDRAGTEAIRLTLEQAARLQDFPDGYVFTGSKTAAFLQVGNAVPRTLARVLAEANRPVDR